MKRLLVLAVMIVAAVLLLVVQAEGQNAGRNTKIEKESRKLEREWFDAFVHRDIAALDRLMADDYFSTNAAGEFHNKKEVLAWVEAGSFAVSSYETADFLVRVYGDTAVVTGRSTWKGQIKGQEHLQGRDSAVHVRHTQVWVKRQGHWQVVAWQGTPIAQP